LGRPSRKGEPSGPVASHLRAATSLELCDVPMIQQTADGKMSAPTESLKASGQSPFNLDPQNKTGAEVRPG